MKLATAAGIALAASLATAAVYYNNADTELYSVEPEIEKEFISDSLPVELIGMNSTLMKEYIEFCADRLLHTLGVKKYYNTVNPFEWMEVISLQGKTNFFEKRVGEYAKSGVGVDASEQVFDLDADF